MNSEGRRRLPERRGESPVTETLTRERIRPRSSNDNGKFESHARNIKGKVESSSGGRKWPKEEEKLLTLTSQQREAQRVQRIEVRQTAITEVIFKDIFQDLQLSNTHLHELILAGCELTDVHAGVIAQWISTNQTLVEVDLSDNRITDVGVEQLFKAVGSHPTVKVLKAARNSIQTDFASDTIFSSGTSKVEYLDVSGNIYNFLSIERILLALASCKTLRVLRMSDMRLSSIHTHLVLQALSNNSTLFDIAIDMPPADHYTMKQFEDVLLRNTSLVSFKTSSRQSNSVLSETALQCIQANQLIKLHGVTEAVKQCQYAQAEGRIESQNAKFINILLEKAEGSHNCMEEEEEEQEGVLKTSAVSQTKDKFIEENSFSYPLFINAFSQENLHQIEPLKLLSEVSASQTKMQPSFPTFQSITSNEEVRIAESGNKEIQKNFEEHLQRSMEAFYQEKIASQIERLVRFEAEKRIEVTTLQLNERVNSQSQQVEKLEKQVRALVKAVRQLSSQLVQQRRVEQVQQQVNEDDNQHMRLQEKVKLEGEELNAGSSEQRRSSNVTSAISLDAEVLCNGGDIVKKVDQRPTITTTLQIDRVNSINDNKKLHRQEGTPSSSVLRERKSQIVLQQRFQENQIKRRRDTCFSVFYQDNCEQDLMNKPYFKQDQSREPMSTTSAFTRSNSRSFHDGSGVERPLSSCMKSSSLLEDEWQQQSPHHQNNKENNSIDLMMSSQVLRRPSVQSSSILRKRLSRTEALMMFDKREEQHGGCQPSQELLAELSKRGISRF